MVAVRQESPEPELARVVGYIGGPSPASIRKRGLKGDVAVLRRKGQSGVYHKHCRRFRSLGLYELGDSSYGAATDTTFMGQVSKLPRDWVSIVPLSEPARRHLLALGVWSDYEDGIMTSPEFMESGTGETLTTVQFGNGEYVKLEQSHGMYSVSWSCALPLATAFEAMLPLSIESHEISEGFVIADNQLIRGEATSLIGEVRDPHKRVTFARLNGDNLAIAWRADVAESYEGEVRLHECFVVCLNDERNLLEQLLVISGTPSVGANAKMVLAGFGQTLSRYP